MYLKPEKNLKTLLVGAGVSTLSAALQLQHAGSDYEMFEQATQAGGLCQTEATGGFTYDTVSHVLHIRSKEAQTVLADFLNSDCVHVERSSAVYFEGRHIPFPFQAHLGFLPLHVRFRAFFSLLWATLTRSSEDSQPANFSEWIRKHYGESVSELFMRPYNEKLWGVPATELSTDWVGGFVPKTSMMDVLRSFVGHRGQMGYNAKFSYPREGGIGGLVESLKAPLSPIHFEHRMTSLNLEKGEAQFGAEPSMPFADLITCIPLKQLAEITTDLPEDLRELTRSLQSTSVLSLIYCLDQPLPHKHHWIYYHESKFPFFRLFFPSNIHDGMAPQGCSIVAAEISNPASGDHEAVERETLRRLQELGLMKSQSSIVHRSRHFYQYGYPVHDLKREQIVKRVLDYYRSHHVWPVGRFGAWYYSSVDDAIAEGARVAAQVLQSQNGERANLSAK
jgi:protoporphyrinogen oxidase